ncbi:MAG: hypothetical protein R2834_02010 [Rhodothermales bacterium]
MKPTIQRFLLPVALLLLFVGTAAAPQGGFEVRAERPAVDGAVLMVYMFGCDEPQRATVVGMAEGQVDGVRQSRPLTLQARSAGVYDVVWERPAEGEWVLTFTATYHEHLSSLVVPIDDQGVAQLPEADRYGRRFEPIRRELTSADISQALERLAVAGR